MRNKLKNRAILSSKQYCMHYYVVLSNYFVWNHVGDYICLQKAALQ